MTGDGSGCVQGTAVSIEGRGLLIIGPSGAGKSALALDLMAMGGALIADDVVRLIPDDEAMWLAPPEDGPALIEARGIGLLPVARGARARLSLVMDLGAVATERLPEPLLWRRGAFSAPMIQRPPAHLPVQPAAVRAAVLSGGPVDPNVATGRLRLAPEAEGDHSLAKRDESRRLG